ncbi:MAG: J domain-containing protein [Pseudomonadota bacterium]|nr:J domain-containing protein [Pseudomonadota bacterium]
MNAGSGDYYALLGVRRDATAADLRRAYRILAKRWHPDVSRVPGTTVMMARLNCAWEALSDAERRRAYDLSLPAVSRPRGTARSKESHGQREDEAARVAAARRQQEEERRSAAVLRAAEIRRTERERAMAQHIENLKSYRARFVWEQRESGGSAHAVTALVGCVLAFPLLFGTPIAALAKALFTGRVVMLFVLYLGLGWILGFVALAAVLAVVQHLARRWIVPAIAATIPNVWRFRGLQD